MFHMRRLLLLTMVLLLGFGCIQEKTFSENKAESILSRQEYDIDKDGIADYIVIDYSTVKLPDAEMTIKRQVTIATHTKARYTHINRDLEDIDFLTADQSLSEFSKSKVQADSACSGNIGVLNVVCSEVETCTRLCSAASVQCKVISSAYGEPLTDSMLSYIYRNNELKSLIIDARRMVLNLKDSSDDERNEFLMTTREAIAKIADINANPIYSNPELMLCDYSDYGVEYLIDAAGKIGTYETEISEYHYRVLVTVTPIDNSDNNDVGSEVGGINILDKIPINTVYEKDQIESLQQVETRIDGADMKIGWSSSKSSKKGYLLAYEFTSTTAPEIALVNLKSPTLTAKMIDLTGLVPTNYAVLLLNDILNNYYLALGIAIGLTLAAIFFLYNLAILIVNMVLQMQKGQPWTAGFRKAFGKTDVRWKNDVIIAALFLVGGFYASAFLASKPIELPSLLEAGNFLVDDEKRVIGVGLTMVGVVMVYLALENLAKVIILERSYGIVIKKEKELLATKAAKVKEKIGELQKLVDEYTKEEFEIGREYEVLTSIRPEKIDQMLQNATAQNKARIEDDLDKVESAIDSLKEKKRMAEENWPKWSESIGKLIAEQNEVSASSLLTIPASLRVWALRRYTRETQGTGLTVEGDSVKRKQVTPGKLVRDMVDQGLLTGVIVIRQETVEIAEFAGGNATVMKALGLKMRAYANALAKNLGQHNPQTFASVGKNNVILFMRVKDIESILFMPKDKFKDTVAEWKERIKKLEKVLPG